jgi:hypothetical protein
MLRTAVSIGSESTHWWPSAVAPAPPGQLRSIEVHKWKSKSSHSSREVS